MYKNIGIIPISFFCGGIIMYKEMKIMERIINFLKEADTYYLATIEGDQPRVRPFGTAHLFEGKLYIQTCKVKDV